MNVLISTLASLVVMAPLVANIQTNAQTNQNTAEPVAAVSLEDDSVSTRAFTLLDLQIESSPTDKTVTAVLANTFTLFPSIVHVTLKLCSSLAKTTDITEMTLEGTISSSDLNMNDSISVTASNHNEDRYWVAYAIYFKSGGNKIYQSDPTFITAAGM